MPPQAMFLSLLLTTDVEEIGATLIVASENRLNYHVIPIVRYSPHHQMLNALSKLSKLSKLRKLSRWSKLSKLSNLNKLSRLSKLRKLIS